MESLPQNFINQLESLPQNFINQFMSEQNDQNIHHSWIEGEDVYNVRLKKIGSDYEKIGQLSTSVDAFCNAAAKKTDEQFDQLTQKLSIMSFHQNEWPEVLQMRLMEKITSDPNKQSILVKNIQIYASCKLQINRGIEQKDNPKVFKILVGIASELEQKKQGIPQLCKAYKA